MIKADINDIEGIVRSYIFAKDNNKPHLMKEAFTDVARLDFVLKTESIWFPSNAVGLDAITDILVRKFGQTYENVYTFCIADSVKREADALSCNWLVGMTEKEGGNVRIGCGRYDWHFENGDFENGRFKNGQKTLADRLTITIEEMVVLNAEFSSQILGWVSKLPYPWCDYDAMFESMPDIESLNTIREKIA